MSDKAAVRNERILILEDDPGVGECVVLLVRTMGCDVELATDGAAGLAKLRSEPFDLLVSDLRLPDMDGLEVMRAMREHGPEVPVILMTSYSSLDGAIQALRAGAVDYIIKPFQNEEFRHSVERALAEQRMRRENARLKRDLKKVTGAPAILGDTPAIRRVLDLIARVAPSDANVLIQGESGTGKELVAQAIHDGSRRASAPFVAINCGAIPGELLESELFGHARGAYTGAVSSSEGLIREAHGGTLFLDEISELAPQLQVKLLRVIQEKQVRPLGSKHMYQTDVRFLAATNRDLKQALERGDFRADLYYRLNVINIHVPPLRERGGDIDTLAQHFIEQHSRRLGKRITGMSEDLRRFMHSYHWPGNVRELENLIERAVILADDNLLQYRDSIDLPPPNDVAATPAELATEALERGLSIERYVEEFVRRYEASYSDSQLAAMLGIGRKALWVRRGKWGLKRAAGRSPRRGTVSERPH
jgi:DNA-binding NtrC family response regulator